MVDFLNYAESRQAARRKLPRGLFEYIDRGVGDEVALKKIRESLDNTELMPSLLSGVTNPETSCNLFGTVFSAPFAIAPTAMAGLVHLRGEEALARAAGRLGVPFSLSTQSLSSIDDVACAAPQTTIWMQVYLWQNLSFSEKLLQRAWDAGARVAVMTVDTPVPSRKEWNIRSGFNMPFKASFRNLFDMALHPQWLAKVMFPQIWSGTTPVMKNYPEGIQPRLVGRDSDPRVSLIKGLSWDHVSWLRDRWKGTLILKGILSPQDAKESIDRGVDGVIVSSHGGRSFDAAPSPISVISDISSVCRNKIIVLADSGVRRGVDIHRYIQGGAHAVMVGRLPLWALACDGERGVHRALTILLEEYTESLHFSSSGKR